MERTINQNRLRGAVSEMYGSCAQFARVLKWSYRKTFDIVSKKQEPTLSEIHQMAVALGVMSDPNAFVSLFFGDAVRNAYNQDVTQGN